MAERPPRPRVWITRTEPEAHATARRVAALGGEPFIAPVLEVVALKTDWPVTAPDALILTSAHALEALMVDGPFAALKTVTLFTVGESLKARAQAAGFSSPLFAAPTAEALIDVITAELPPSSHILYARPRDPAFPLGTRLIAQGFSVADVIAYETKALSPALPAPYLGAPFFILLHSPKAALQTGRLIRTNTNVMKPDATDRFRLDVLTFICISEPTQAALIEGLGSGDETGVCCAVAATPDEAGLMGRLTELLATVLPR